MLAEFAFRLGYFASTNGQPKEYKHRIPICDLRPSSSNQCVLSHVPGSGPESVSPFHGCRVVVVEPPSSHFFFSSAVIRLLSRSRHPSPFSFHSNIATVPVPGHRRRSAVVRLIISPVLYSSVVCTLYQCLSSIKSPPCLFPSVIRSNVRPSLPLSRTQHVFFADLLISSFKEFLFKFTRGFRCSRTPIIRTQNC